jgi:hypothetical protein
MDGHEPQVTQSRLQDLVDIGVPVEPVEEGLRVPFEPRRWGCHEVDALPADGAGDDLHRPGAVVTPGADPDLPRPAAAGGKQGSVPREKPFGRERPIMVAGGVEHHLDDAFHVSVCRVERADLHAEAARDRRAYLLSLEPLPLDLAALDDVRSQGPQNRLLPEVEAEGLHAAEQAPLPMAHGRQRLCQVVGIPPKSGPVQKLVDVHSPLVLRRL